jgi:hypothetical protein
LQGRISDIFRKTGAANAYKFSHGIQLHKTRFAANKQNRQTIEINKKYVAKLDNIYTMQYDLMELTAQKIDQIAKSNIIFGSRNT